jgi:hypothetical protein
MREMPPQLRYEGGPQQRAPVCAAYTRTDMRPHGPQNLNAVIGILGMSPLIPALDRLRVAGAVDSLVGKGPPSTHARESELGSRQDLVGCRMEMAAPPISQYKRPLDAKQKVGVLLTRHTAKPPHFACRRRDFAARAVRPTEIHRSKGSLIGTRR